MTTIASGFSASKPISCAMGRYGELILAQGGGVQPKRWTGSGTATNAGIVAPTVAPTVTASNTVRYYVARVDVSRPGAVYNAPPAVTFSTPASPPAGFRAAKAQAYLDQSSLNEVVVTDGGKHYPSPPSVSLSDSHGKNAVITPVLNGVPPAANSLTYYRIDQGPPFDDEWDANPIRRTQWSAWGPVVINVSGSGGTITKTVYLYHNACGKGPNDATSYLPVNLSLSYTVSGATGSGAKARINFYGQSLAETRCIQTGPSSTTQIVLYSLSYLVRSVTVDAVGSGYSTTNAVVIEVAPSISWDLSTGALASPIPASKKLIIYGYPPGHADNASSERFSLTGLTVANGGSGYVVAPELQITSDSGFGAFGTCAVTNGAISSAKLENGGGGYKLAPTVTILSGGAEAFAVSRPHLRGKYQCYYRYVDNTSAANGGPIPSNLSPVTEVDAGEGSASITWSVTAPPAGSRTLTAELWRTTGDQALTLYRVGTGTSLVDDLTDDELRDANRAGYAAMPIVLPNGELNANRFRPPPADKAVVVKYQDRFWYGVDTGGSEPNSVYFSEVDEPESVPDVNEFVLQQNARDSDAISALIPFGTSLLIMQSRHAFSLSFSRQPLLDANVSPIANRGCLGQRCWDIHAEQCYVLDRHGLYAIDPGGRTEDLSAPIEDIFRSRIDWANSTWNFVAVDQVSKVVRAWVAFKEDNSSGYPTRALCMSIDTKTWWIERYPQRISAGATVPMTNGDHRSVCGSESGVYILNEGQFDVGRGSITSVTVTNKGAGYRTPPTVTAPSGVGAELQAVINAEGQVTGVWIINPGHGYTSGSLTFSAPDDPTCASPVTAVASFTATANNSNSTLYPAYRYKSGNMQFASDSNTQNPPLKRDITLTYKPQDAACEVAARLYYNNSRHARPNIVSRNRGIGFTMNAVDGAARLDMARQTTRTGYDAGVAKASFSGRTLEDIQSSDNHVAVEILGVRKNADPVVVYAMNVSGVVGG